MLHFWATTNIKVLICGFTHIWFCFTCKLRQPREPASIEAALSAYIKDFMERHADTDLFWFKGLWCALFVANALNRLRVSFGDAVAF